MPQPGSGRRRHRRDLDDHAEVLARITAAADPWHRGVAAELPDEALASARRVLAAILRATRD